MRGERSANVVHRYLFPYLLTHKEDAMMARLHIHNPYLILPANLQAATSTIPGSLQTPVCLVKFLRVCLAYPWPPSLGINPCRFYPMQQLPKPSHVPLWPEFPFTHQVGSRSDWASPKYQHGVVPWESHSQSSSSCKGINESSGISKLQFIHHVINIHMRKKILKYFWRPRN